MNIRTKESTKWGGIPLYCDRCGEHIDKAVAFDYRGDDEIIICKKCLTEAFNLINT